MSTYFDVGIVVFGSILTVLLAWLAVATKERALRVPAVLVAVGCGGMVIGVLVGEFLLFLAGALVAGFGLSRVPTSQED